MGVPGKSSMPRVSPDETRVTFGLEVRVWRRSRQMTLADLEQSSGVSVGTLRATGPNGARSMLTKVVRIAQRLAGRDEWFFTWGEGDAPLEPTCVVRPRNRRNLSLHYGGDPSDLDNSASRRSGIRGPRRTGLSAGTEPRRGTEPYRHTSPPDS